MHGRWRLLTIGGLAIPLMVVAWSFGSYVLVDNGDTMQQRAVTWGRDHHLGALMNRLERERYASPPSKRAATELAVNSPASPTIPPGLSANADAGPAPGVRPAPLSPSIAPALAGEGTWQVIDSAGGAPAVWATSIRPLAAYPSVLASVAEID